MANAFKDWTPERVMAHNRKIMERKTICGQLSSAVNERKGSEMPTESNGMRQPLASRIARRSTEKSGATNPYQKKGTPRNLAYTQAQVIAWCKENGLPEPVFELVFHPTRKWRMDIAFAQSTSPRWARVAIEVQGGIWIRGGHSRGAAQKNDWEKLHEAQILGWKVFYCEPKDLLTKETADMIKRLLNS